MAQLKDDLLYLIAKSGVTLAGLLSEKNAFRFGGMLGRIAYWILASRRKVAYDNLKKAFGDRYNDTEYDEIIVGVFENIGRTMIEFARFPITKPERIKQIIKSTSLDILDKVKDEGKGGVIVTAHFGNWEMLGPFFAVLGYNVDAIVTIQHNAKIDKMITGFRKAYKLGLILVGASNYRKIFKTLRDNRFVIIAPDQHDPSEALIMDFFGRKTSVARGPGLFAVKNNSPIIPILNRRINFDDFEILISKPIYPPKTGNEEEDVKQMTREYMDCFEKAIRQYPSQWMWTHKRWKLN
jgi:KDO2-lipid IV(A) lauroyltransferase